MARHSRGPHGRRLRPALVDDGVGALVTIDDRPFAVLMFTVADDRIVAIDALRDPERVRRFADAAGIPRSPVTSTAGEGS